MTDINMAKLYRKAVLKRDNGLCQRCLSLGIWTPAVDVHHGIHKTQGDYLRYLMDNGVSLCRQCHSLDDKGELQSWFISWVGEDKYYKMRQDNIEIVRTKSFDVDRAMRKLKDYLNQQQGGPLR
jgi:hypothetical protein